MSETKAIVAALDGEYALVRTGDGGCGRCHEKGGCGSANISQMFCGDKDRTWRVLNRRGAVVGETVTVRVAEGALSAGVTLLYLLPLLLLVAGAIIGAHVAGEAGGIGGGLAGLAAAWLWVARRLKARQGDPRFQPYIV